MAAFSFAFRIFYVGFAPIRNFLAWVCVIGSGVLLGTSSYALAVEPEQATTSVVSSGLTIAPIDTDVYLGGMNLRTQWSRFQSTQFYYEVSQNRLVQSMITRWKGEWEAKEGQLGDLRKNIENPNVMSLIEMGADMISDEVFLFADGRLSELLLQANEIVQEVMSLINEVENSPESELELREFFLSLPKADVDALEIPLVVEGFKVADKDRVLDKIDQLEGLLRFGLGSIPEAAPFAEGLERIEDSRGTRLAWSIDSAMFPWELMSDSGDPDIIEKVQDLLDERQVCFTIGLLDGYLIFALSESQEDVSNLGGSESLLAHEDMKPVKEVTSKTVTSVSYVSDAYMDAYFQTNLQDFFTKNSKAVLKQIENQVEGDLLEILQNVPEDLAWLDETIDDLVPDFKGQTAFSYLSDVGAESVVYNRMEDVVFDALKPLPILEHVGKDPLLFISFRLQDHPEYFATARKIVQKLKGYAVAYLESDYGNQENRAKEKAVFEKAWPLLTELADLWEKKFLPAMRDGQHALVLQAGNLENTQWWKDMPVSTKPLPLPEVALVTGLSSKSGMVEAYDGLFKWFDRYLEVVREAAPESVPAQYQIPRPEESKVTIGDRYSYAIPDDCPVPKTMAPQAIFTDNFMVACYSDLQAQSLATGEKLSINNPMLQSKEPKAMAVYVHVGKLTQLALPWIVYGIETQTEGLDAVLTPEDGSMPEVKYQDIVDLWKTLGSLGEATASTVAGEGRGTIVRSRFSIPTNKRD